MFSRRPRVTMASRPMSIVVVAVAAGVALFAALLMYAGDDPLDGTEDETH